MTEDELILTHILSCSRSELYLKKQTLTEQQQKQFESYKSRRIHGEPLQYILGTCNFLGFELKVDPRVLIPRPETEILVDHAIKTLKGGQSQHILDLGTGSGNIAITIASLLPAGHVTTVDLSQDALTLAEENANKHGVKNKISFIYKDMVDFLKEESKRGSINKFDLIISNPPYVPKEQVKSLPCDVQQEPVLALAAGEDGLMFYRYIIKFSPSLIRLGGYLMMEFGDGQGLAISQLLQEQSVFSNIEILQDLAGRDRIISAQKI